MFSCRLISHIHSGTPGGTPLWVISIHFNVFLLFLASNKSNHANVCCCLSGLQSVFFLFVQVEGRIWEESTSSNTKKMKKKQRTLKNSAPSVSAYAQCRLRRQTVVYAVSSSLRHKLSSSRHGLPSTPSKQPSSHSVVSKLQFLKFCRLRLPNRRLCISSSSPAYCHLRLQTTISAC